MGESLLEKQHERYVRQRPHGWDVSHINMPTLWVIRFVVTFLTLLAISYVWNILEPLIFSSGRSKAISEIRLILVPFICVALYLFWRSYLKYEHAYRTYRRHLRQQCVVCGYSLQGNPEATQCPECGAE